MDFVAFILSFWLISEGAVAAVVTAWIARRWNEPHGLWRLAWGFWAAPWVISVLLGGIEGISAQALLVRTPFGIPVWLSAAALLVVTAAWWKRRPQ